MTCNLTNYSRIGYYEVLQLMPILRNGFVCKKVLYQYGEIDFFYNKAPAGLIMKPKCVP